MILTMAKLGVSNEYSVALYANTKDPITVTRKLNTAISWLLINFTAIKTREKCKGFK